MRDDDQPWSLGWLKCTGTETGEKRKRLPRGEFVLVFWRDGKRQRFRLDTDSEAEARRRAPTIYASALRPRGNTVAELWEAYCRANEGKPSVAIMRHQWKALEPFFGSMNAETITIDDCEAYAAERRAAGRKDGTIITELGRIRMVLNWAKKRDIIKEARHIQRPRAVKSKTEHLTARQVIALADACKAPHLSLFVHLAYATAGRAGAILGLTWDRVHFERNKIDLEDPEMKAAHKGRAVVPMTRTLKVRLLEAQRGARTPYVIEWAGERVGSVKKGLATAAKAAGLPHVHPHMLRHSAAVRQAEMGVPMDEIASHLGHSNTKVTRDIYARFSPEALTKSAAALELDDLEPRPVRFGEPGKSAA